MKVDYIAIMQKYHGGRNDGFITDVPRPIQLADDDYVRVRYDAQTMRWIANHKTLRRWCTQTIED